VDTLWVILGPLTASEDWAKKTKVKVRITNREMMSLWKPAMIDMSNVKWCNKERQRARGQGQAVTTADGIAEKAGAWTRGLGISVATAPIPTFES
jgi:hypothetical protein